MYASSVFLSVFLFGVFVLGCCIYSLLDHSKRGYLVTKRKGLATRVANPLVHSYPWWR